MLNPAGSEAKLENKQQDSSLAKCKCFRSLSIYPITQSNILQIKAINSQITCRDRGWFPTLYSTANVVLRKMTEKLRRCL